jgi:hypothetical protein
MKTWSRSKTVVARFRGAEGPAALQVIGDYANDSIGHLPGGLRSLAAAENAKDTNVQIAASFKRVSTDSLLSSCALRFGG